MEIVLGQGQVNKKSKELTSYQPHFSPKDFPPQRGRVSGAILRSRDIGMSGIFIFTARSRRDHELGVLGCRVGELRLGCLFAICPSQETA